MCVSQLQHSTLQQVWLREYVMFNCWCVKFSDWKISAKNIGFLCGQRFVCWFMWRTLHFFPIRNSIWWSTRCVGDEPDVWRWRNGHFIYWNICEWFLIIQFANVSDASTDDMWHCSHLWEIHRIHMAQNAFHSPLFTNYSGFVEIHVAHHMYAACIMHFSYWNIPFRRNSHLHLVWDEEVAQRKANLTVAVTYLIAVLIARWKCNTLTQL